LPEVPAREAFVARRFREARDEKGKLRYLSHEEEASLIAALPVVEVA
jgi:hypothetical protein